MTREEAIKIIKSECYVFNPFNFDSARMINTALDVAIKALEQQPSEDAISRQALLERINKAEENFKYDNMESISSDCEDPFVDGVLSGVFNIRQMVIQAQPATPKPKKGQWIAQDIHNCHTDFKCSACGYIHSFTHLYGEPTADYTYCPNCGAKMEVEE